MPLDGEAARAIIGLIVSAACLLLGCVTFKYREDIGAWTMCGRITRAIPGWALLPTAVGLVAVGGLGIFLSLRAMILG